MHDPLTATRALRLLADGLTVSEVARQLGLPRPTVNNWKRRGAPTGRRSREAAPDWRPADPAVYCYVLGLYLGDGCVSARSPHAAYVRIALDAAYPDLTDEAEAALQTVFEQGRVRRYRFAREPGRIDLQVSCPEVLRAFPQHGPGKKHERKIELVPWQLELTHAYPEAFIRGLIHSDGCRSVNRFKTKLPSGRVAEYEYPRYFFSNLSADIRAIFIEHCELLGITCTTGHERNVSVSDRKSVAILETIVGPKS